MADDIIPDARARARQHLEAALGTGVRGTLRDAIRAALDLAAGTRPRDLTELEYAALRPGQRLVDPQRPGFLAKASRNGVHFIYRHNHPTTGARTETSIGYLPAVSLSAAREQWAGLRARRLSGQPGTRDTESPDASIPTMAELVRVYLDDYAAKVKRSWRDDERLLTRHVLPKYGTLLATAFTADDAAELLAGLSGTPREAGKVRAVLSVMFSVAVGRTRRIAIGKPWLPRGYANPIANVQTLAHTPRQHRPHEAEIRRYAAALRTPGTLRGDIADVLTLQLLSACRLGEVVGAEWTELDLEHGKWHIPPARMKSGDPHTVVLSRQALALLERRRNFATGPFVFPRPTDHRQPLRTETIQRALGDNREGLGVAPEFASHAIRVSFMTWSAERGYPAEVRNRCTAHRLSGGIDAVYSHPELSRPAAELWQAWADWLMP